MNSSIRALCFSVVCLLWLSGSSATLGNEVNAKCPVLQDRNATADYAVTYKGQEIRFCCSECVTEFLDNPEIYESVLPQLQDIPLRARLQMFLGDHGGLVVGSILLVILVALRIHRLRHPVRAAESESRIGRLLQRRISPTVPLLALSGYLGFEVYHLQAHLQETQLEDEIHFATFYDFGYPPVPKRPDTEPRVRASFYRGNDERSPKLFNEGNYRTATFHVSLCDGDQKPVDIGDQVDGRDLFLKFEIDRPPFTPDFLYNEQMMSTMFLTAECDRFLGRDQPVPDAVGLTETEPMQSWVALYPIRRANDCCHREECRGTVYACQRHFHQPKLAFLGKRLAGARFHYGIRYDLQIRDGVLHAGSDVYMGALYRTRKLPTWRVPMSQWFSHEPIPVLPGENVDDPELLGIDEHLARQIPATSQH